MKQAAGSMTCVSAYTATTGISVTAYGGRAEHCSECSFS